MNRLRHNTTFYTIIDNAMLTNPTLRQHYRHRTLPRTMDANMLTKQREVKMMNATFVAFKKRG